MALNPYCCAPRSRLAVAPSRSSASGPGRDMARDWNHAPKGGYETLPGRWKRITRTLVAYRWIRPAGVSRKPAFSSEYATDGGKRSFWTRRIVATETRDDGPPSRTRAAGVAAVGPVGVDVERPRRSLHDFPGNDHFLDPFQARQIEHGVEQDALHDRAQAARPGLAFDRLAGDGAERLFRQGQVHALHLEQPLVLFYQGVLRLREDLLQRRLIEILQSGDHRQAADEFGDQTILEQVLRLDLAEDFAGAAIF